MAEDFDLDAELAVTDRMMADLEKRRVTGKHLVQPTKSPSAFRRMLSGIGKAADEGMDFAWETVISGAKDVKENIGEVVDPTGDVNLPALGRTALGAANVVGGIPAGMARTAVRAPVRAAKGILDTQTEELPAFVDWAEIPVGMALPVVPGGKLLNMLKRGSAGVTAAVGPLGDITKAEKFTKDLFGVSPGQAVRDGLIEAAEGGGYKFTEDGLKVADGVARRIQGRLALGEGKPKPTRVIEAPPSEEDRLTRSVRERISPREKLREEQVNVTGEYVPEPQARILREGALRDPESGRTVIGPRERVPQGEGPVIFEDVGTRPENIRTTPRDVKTGPSAKERIEGYDQVDNRPPRQRDFPGTPEDDPRVAQVASSTDDVVREMAPARIRAAAEMNDPLPDADGILTALRSLPGKAKTMLIDRGIRTPFNSMTEISRGDEAFTALVQATKDASRNSRSLADKWIDQRDAIREAVGGDDAFADALRARDAGLPSRLAPETQKMVDEFYDGIAEAVGIPRGHPLFKEGYVSRLRQNHVVQESKLTVVTPYTSEDINRIIPQRSRPGFLKERKTQTLGDDASYTPEGVGSYIRAAARAASLGTDVQAGYLKQIQPLLEELSNRPDDTKRLVTDYVNYFIGAQGSRSTSKMNEWSQRFRSINFVRTIGGNVLSPLWNSTQQALTFAEVRPSAFARAYEDLPKIFRKDPEITDLLERAGVAHELKSSSVSVIADPADVPTEMMGKFDRGLAKLANTSGVVFRKAERWNRTHAFLAGYHDGIASGLDDAAAITNGKRVMDKTQFVGGEADLPPAYRKAAGAAFGQFKTFQTKYLEYIKNNFTDMFKEGASPEERFDAFKKFGKFWSSQMVLGGTSGVPFIGDWLEDNIGRLPGDVQRGVGGLLGISLANQVGAGVLPIDNLRSFLFTLPSPTFAGAQDAASIVLNTNFGEGGDFSNAGTSMTPEERARRVTRLFPAGSQLNRLRRAAQLLLSDGEARESRDSLEAFGLSGPTGAVKTEVQPGVLQTAIGFRSTEQERETDIRRDEAQKDRVRDEAIRRAAEAYALGEDGESILLETEEELGEKLRLTEGAIKGARERLRLSPLERLRRSKARRGQVVPSPTE